MNCEQIEEFALMRRFLDGALAGDEKREFQQHVSGCESCQGALQLSAALMLQEPLPVGRAIQEASETSPGLWTRFREWLFPEGVGVWQPALAFAAVLVVAIPMLRSVWLPTDPDAAGSAITYRAGVDGELQPLPQQLRGAIEALSTGEAEAAFALLDSRKVNWDRARMENVFVAYRVRARAAAELGWVDAAQQDLNRAMSFAELDPARVACIEQDLKAVHGEGTWCSLPQVNEIN